MIYLDYAANCPVDKRVLEDFNLNTILYFANPNSSHELGQIAKEKIDETSNYIANLFGVKKENIIYTSGSTESNNLVIKGFAEKYENVHFITTSIEHSSIIAPMNYMMSKGCDVDILDVDENGMININSLERLIDDRKTLVSITSVESETGIIEDIEKISKVLKKYENVYFHTDATQAIGKLDINFENVDMITFTPHKLYGINGIGVLVKKDTVKLAPQMLGGKSTTIYRSGTPALPLILSIKKALKLACCEKKKNNEYLEKLNKKLRLKIEKYKNVVINSKGNCIPNTLNISIRNIPSKEFAKRLEDEEIYVSTKSACSSENNVSKIIYAMTNDSNLALSTIRISISHMTTEEEIDEFLDVFDELYNELEEKYSEK